jgi:hypothetical protein
LKGQTRWERSLFLIVVPQRGRNAASQYSQAGMTLDLLQAKVAFWPCHGCTACASSKESTHSVFLEKMVFLLQTLWALVPLALARCDRCVAGSSHSSQKKM